VGVRGGFERLGSAAASSGLAVQIMIYVDREHRIGPRIADVLASSTF